MWTPRSQRARRLAVATALGSLVVLAGCGGGSSGGISGGAGNDNATDVAGTGSGDQSTDSSTSALPNFSEYRGQYFFAALPDGWQVLAETANGIDLATPGRDAGVSFSYVYGSAAAAIAGGAAVDNDGYAQWLLSSQQAQNVRIVSTEQIGSFTDAIDTTWTFDGREFDAVANGDDVHGVLEIGTAMGPYGDWVGMAWERVAKASVWDEDAPLLAAVSRSIVIEQVQSAGSSLRMPAAVESSGDISATQDEVDARSDYSDAIRGYETLVDPTTGDHYDAPYESYDPERGGYFLSNGNQLENEP